MGMLDRLIDNARSYAVFTDYFREIERIILQIVKWITAQDWTGAMRSAGKGLG